MIAFLNGVADERKWQDSFAILAMMQEVTQTEPKMWGDSIVGFGKYQYKYESGREGDMPVLRELVAQSVAHMKKNA
ncbi:MAG: hypothetical protein KJ069_08345 [Anaerolineae bacterium]|nr:hypothetical protein [Anaerolineae bacterium]